MTISTIKSKFSKTITGRLLISSGVLLFWLFLWQLAAIYVGKAILLPAPFDVIVRIFELGADGAFWLTAAASVGRIMLGFLIGVTVGALLGFLCFKFTVIKRLFNPILVIVRATPVASFIILALVWLTSVRVPSFTAFLMVLPIVCENTCTALEQTDKQLLEMETLFKFNTWQKIKTLYLHSFLPYFLSSARMSLGLAWKAGIAAEVLCTPALSIGKNLYEAKIYMETTDVFAWTVVIIILSLILEKLIILLFGKLVKRKGKEKSDA